MNHGNVLSSSTHKLDLFITSILFVVIQGYEWLNQSVL